MSFPSDIKGCMKDCILALIWPKKGIVAFFADNGCTNKDLTPVMTFEEQQLSRSKIIDSVFAQLSGKSDGGLGEFRAMLQALLQWSHFDPYYFDTLHKLDRKTAQKCLDHLKQLQEIRDAKIREERQHRASVRDRAQTSNRTIRELRDHFLSLYSESVRLKRGATSWKRFSAISRSLRTWRQPNPSESMASRSTAPSSMTEIGRASCRERV